MTQHDMGCRHTGEHSDAAKRLSDMYNLHLETGRIFAGQYVSGHTGKWMAFSLADAKSDGVLYDNKYDAVRHQHHNEQYYGFIPINPMSLSICAAESLIKWKRGEYEMNKRLLDRNSKTGGPTIIPRLTTEDQERQNWLLDNSLGVIAVGNPE